MDKYPAARPLQHSRLISAVASSKPAYRLSFETGIVDHLFRMARQNVHRSLADVAQQLHYRSTCHRIATIYR